MRVLIQLKDYQVTAVEKMHNGCVLKGGTGSGKTLTSLVYVYEKIIGGETPVYPGHTFKKPPVDIPLYVITVPKKRDDGDWVGEGALIPIRPIVDSWNNIKKYEHITDAVFIFDETKILGYGAWTWSFLRIARNNKWVLLTATPADTWLEYAPLFVANGFYKNKTSFEREHVVWSRYSKYPKVEKYIGVPKLIRFRDSILVNMYFDRDTIQNHKQILCKYDTTTYEILFKDRWDVYNNQPIRDISQLCHLLRRLVNTDESRIKALTNIYRTHKRIIIFYNFNCELDLLRKWCEQINVVFGEWNGQKHDPLPTGIAWVYLCQYTAAQEAWNCIETNCTVFFSQTYSYKALIQSTGRIDRMNTPFTDLYYYHLLSDSPIDNAIQKALAVKENFNESKWLFI